MALNLTSRLQVTAHYFWNRRNAAALSHHGVRLDYDPEQRRMSALVLGYVLTVLAIGLAALMAYIKPAGQVGQSEILADRDTGAIYVMVAGRLHPALNLTSARLISGEAKNPDVRQSRRAGQVPAGPHGRHRRRPNANADPHRPGFAVGGMRHRARGHSHRFGRPGPGGDRDRRAAQPWDAARHLC